MLEAKGNGWNHLPCSQQGQSGDRRGKQVDVHHLVVLRGLMLLEELLLEGRGQSIQSQEAAEKEEALEAVAGVDFGMSWACHEELCATQSNCQSHHPVSCTVRLSRNDHSPNHDRHHLEALPQHLHGERYILQGLILAGAGVDIRQGHDQVLPQRRLVHEGFAFCNRHAHREDYGSEPVAQNKEHGVSEEAPIIGDSHDALL
mmetsp:Transcript_31774/g.73345  ORF Transcript_31774/g.73345 Transcript_31774/m.73345 type:complete len:202 (-) Transcript_31774:140-745(-)